MITHPIIGGLLVSVLAVVVIALMMYGLCY
jgi:hypothetical protein